MVASRLKVLVGVSRMNCAGPFLDLAAVGVMALAQAPEIGAIVRRMHERIILRLRRDREVEPRQRVALDDAASRRWSSSAAGSAKSTSATELPNTSCIQRIRPGGESVKLGADEAQVMAVARAQHQPVLAELDRRRIAVGGGVADGEEFHGRALIASVAEVPEGARTPLSPLPLAGEGGERQLAQSREPGPSPPLRATLRSGEELALLRAIHVTLAQLATFGLDRILRSLAPCIVAILDLRDRRRGSDP